MDKTKQKIAKFISQLLAMIDDPCCCDIIGWNQDGTLLCIHDQHKFTQIILPKYGSHSNFQSFVRQLNLYGFKKAVVDDKEPCCAYGHADFHREALLNYPKITRTHLVKKSSGSSAPSDHSTVASQTEKIQKMRRLYCRLLKENQGLHQEKGILEHSLQLIDQESLKYEQAITRHQEDLYISSVIDFGRAESSND